jgi:hypothetical protein
MKNNKKIYLLYIANCCYGRSEPDEILTSIWTDKRKMEQAIETIKKIKLFKHKFSENRVRIEEFNINKFDKRIKEEIEYEIEENKGSEHLSALI